MSLGDNHAFSLQVVGQLAHAGGGCHRKERLGAEGLHIRIGETGEPQLLAVDNIVICAGQDPLRELHDGPLRKARASASEDASKDRQDAA